MEQILDLHIHSRYSRACSKNLIPEIIAQTCVIRGLDIVSTGDFTHPKWLEILANELEEIAPGIFGLKNHAAPTRFILGTEVASIKKHNGQLRRVHHLIFAPSFASVKKFNQKLIDLGCNLGADGRPILGLTSKHILNLILETDAEMMLIPAHAWTPWFGIFGSKGGYDTLTEAFEDLTPYVRAIETGLSSDPLMNWGVPAVDGLTLISNSDAHSPQKLGREANVFSFNSEKEVTYLEIKRIIEQGDRTKFLSTIEFYPEEGKYHHDGCADCKFFCLPNETKKYGNRCPKCQKILTVGVLSRMSDLGGRTVTETEKQDKKRIPYQSLVPLPEIIADTIGVGVATKAVRQIYETIIKKIGNEFFVLLHADLQTIATVTTPEIARAVQRVRTGNIFIKPGYDGIFGIVKVFQDQDHPRFVQEKLDYF